MNSAKMSPDRLSNFKLSRQAIVERSCALWGSEIQINSTSNLHDLPHALHREYCDSLEYVYGEALKRITARSAQAKDTLTLAPRQSVMHTFFRIDQPVLMIEDTLKQLIQTANALEKYQHKLVVSVDNPLDSLPGPLERRAMVRQLYALKDHCGVKLAYNNYKLDTKQGDLLIELELYDYIKMPFPDSALRLNVNTHSDLFDRLYERMLQLISNAKVSFIADSVEFADTALLAKHLPFDYFQGGYYSSAENF